MINPEQAKKLNKRKLALNIIRIAEVLISRIDEVLADEIDSLIEGEPQEFSMRQFADEHLNNKDEHLFTANRFPIVQDIVHQYDINGWDALVIADTDIVIAIRIEEETDYEYNRDY